MSEINIVDAPTFWTVGLSTSPTIYPFGITVRMLIISCSILSSDAGLLLYATTAEIVKLFLLPIIDGAINAFNDIKGLG